MPAAVSVRAALPVALAAAGLFTAGVAALGLLALRRRDHSTPWKTVLAQFAAANPWSGRDLLFVLAAIASAQLVRGFLPASTLLDVLALQGAALAGLGWRLRGKTRPFGAAAPARAVLAQALLRWLAILPILWFLSFVWQLLLAALGHAPDFQLAVRMFLDAGGPARRAAFVFFAVVVAPIAEEATFRGVLLPLLVRRLGPAWGVALVAVGFAALHADLGTACALAAFSVALSLAYARTGTLLVPIAMHALFNGANLLLLLGLVRAGWAN